MLLSFSVSNTFFSFEMKIMLNPFVFLLVRHPIMQLKEKNWNFFFECLLKWVCLKTLCSVAMIFKNSEFDFCFIFSVTSSELTHRQRQKDRQKVGNNLLGLIHISRKNPHTLMRLLDIVDDENIDFLTLSINFSLSISQSSSS